MSAVIRRSATPRLGLHSPHRRTLATPLEVKPGALPLHRGGAVIIESKSVTSSVRINERDEWTREWNGRSTGMPSPVLQARRQGDFLRKVLQSRREDLLGRAMFGLVQKGFGAFMIDVVVAISDQGVIQHRGQLPEVRKADQVPDRVRELVREHLALAHPLSKDPRSKDWGVTLKAEEFTRTSAFLRASHRERGAAEPASLPSDLEQKAGGRYQPTEHRTPSTAYLAVGPVSVSIAAVSEHPPAPTSAFSCQKCKSPKVEITYGKYGYYFKCLDCEENTRIEVKCEQCQGKARTRKERQNFFAECAPCGTSRLYFMNPG